MAITAGVLSQVSVGPTTASLSATAATGGTGPYTYQWYRSTTTGFTPGPGNLIAGATALTLQDTGLSASTQYYYKVIATDTGHSNDVVTYTQLAVLTTPAALSPNQFGQQPIIGLLDMRFDYDTIAAQIDVSQSGTLQTGQAVKIVDSAGGIPKVVACSANTDECFGFINFDQKTQGYVAGDRCELSQAGNVLYLYATNAIARGAEVQLAVASVGGVAAKVGSSGANIVGLAMDKAPVAGTMIRVKLSCPSFKAA